MPTRPFSVVIDTADPPALGRFWAAALGWPVVNEEPGEVVVAAPEAPAWGEGGPPPLVFVPVDDEKQGKNRLHLDLASDSPAGQQATVRRLLELGAREADIGQRSVPWEVLADPEGNELCVLDPREEYRHARGIAALILDCADPTALASYWTAATGWPVVRREETYVALGHPDGTGTRLELLAVPDARRGKNRLHVDLAPWPGDDQRSEVARLEGAGARRVDVGQGGASWVVLADPEGNEHCVLRPR